jgi:hypothetical protein
LASNLLDPLINAQAPYPTNVRQPPDAAGLLTAPAGAVPEGMAQTQLDPTIGSLSGSPFVLPTKNRILNKRTPFSSSTRT